MTNNNYGGYADFRRCITRLYKTESILFNVMEGEFV